MDGDAGVELGDVAAGCLGLGQRFQGVGLVKEDLALEVGGLDEVAVDEGEGTNTGAGKQRCGGCAHGPAADDGDMGGGQPLLALLANAGEEDLAGIAVGVGDGQGFRRRSLRMRLGLELIGRRDGFV